LIPLLLLFGAGARGLALELLPVAAVLVALVVVPVRGRPAVRWLAHIGLHAAGLVTGWPRPGPRHRPRRRRAPLRTVAAASGADDRAGRGRPGRVLGVGRGPLVWTSVAILTVLWARIPSPHQVWAPARVSNRVRSKP